MSAAPSSVAGVFAADTLGESVADFDTDRGESSPLRWFADAPPLDVSRAASTVFSMEFFDDFLVRQREEIKGISEK